MVVANAEIQQAVRAKANGPAIVTAALTPIGRMRSHRYFKEHKLDIGDRLLADDRNPHQSSHFTSVVVLKTHREVQVEKGMGVNIGIDGGAEEATREAACVNGVLEVKNDVRACALDVNRNHAVAVGHGQATDRPRKGLRWLRDYEAGRGKDDLQAFDERDWTVRLNKRRRSGRRIRPIWKHSRPHTRRHVPWCPVGRRG
ncbi:MAG: hypothetical protein OXG65_00650 [Chloroflexi bacterium]|nr:hypothetical protein [Chloroflexota bacterium]